MWFGQIVIGPPGSGKSTYVAGIQHILKQINRKLLIINLDPFIEDNIYKADINITELIDINKIFNELELGPNGTLIYCMEYLLANFDWLEEKLNKQPDCYLIIDTPGQVELYTHNDALRNIILKLVKLNCRLTSVHIVDSTLCSDNYKYISALLLSLCSQIHLELPHVNVFSKIDLLKHFKNDLNFPLNYYVEVQNLNQLMLYAKYQNLSSSDSEKSIDLMDNVKKDINDGHIKNAKKNYNIQDKYSVLKLLKIIDGANGFRFSSIYSEYSLFDKYVESIEYDCDEIQEKFIDVSDDDFQPQPTA